jgi:hypothetical protein
VQVNYESFLAERSHSHLRLHARVVPRDAASIVHLARSRQNQSFSAFLFVQVKWTKAFRPDIFDIAHAAVLPSDPGKREFLVQCYRHERDRMLIEWIITQVFHQRGNG